MSRPAETWLVFIHQLPTEPAYLRVKISRRLQAIGALALKNTVYALPSNETTLEDFHWLRREIVDAGGDATILESTFVEGLSNEEAVARFNGARTNGYAVIEKQAREARDARAAIGRETGSPAEAELARLRKAMAEAVALDYLGAPGRASAEDRLLELDAAIREPAATAVPRSQILNGADYAGRTWVTRTGVYVDRIASAWLIRRHIDPDARFRFVPSRSLKAQKEEVGFDMFEAEFTHEGDLCTFEVLLKRFDIRARPLRVIAQIIHDLDVKDDRYTRPEGPGVLAAFQGIAARYKKDDDRLKAGFEYLDALSLGLKGSL